MTSEPMGYERTSKGTQKGVAWRFPSPSGDGELMLFATDIRKDRDQAKAYIRIGLPGDAAKAADDLKLRDDGERSALANRGAEQLWGVRYSDPKAAVLRERMLRFCDDLLDFWVGSGSGEWVDGDSSPSAPLWAVPGLILDGATGIHFGRAGGNKSTMQRLVAVSLQWGITDLFNIKAQADVIWVNAEEPPEEHRRQLGNVNAALKIDRTAPLYTIDARGLAITEIAPRLEKAILHTGARHVFIDSLSRLAQGMNLNENTTATLLIDSVSGLGPSMNFIGHTGQENQHRLSGSKHFENAARLMVRVQSRPDLQDQSRRGVRIHVSKANGAHETEDQYFTLAYHPQYGLTGAERAEEREYPPLTCGFEWADGKFCKRTTWDGINPRGIPRCSRHFDDDEE